MSENKKYFYMKVKDTFFDSEEMKILESQKNGFLYQNVYLKMCLLSLKNEGALTFKGIMPYNIEMLSTVLRIDIDTVKTACEIFVKLGLVTITDTETMYMTDIQSLIGQSSTEAERVKRYRERISSNNEKLIGCTESVQMYEKSTPEIEIEIEKKKDIEKDNSHKAKNSKAEQDTKTVIQCYSDNYKKLYSEKKVNTEKPIVNYKQATILIKKLLKSISQNDLLKVIDNAKSDEWIVSQGYSLTTILSASQVNKLLNAKNQKPSYTPRSDAQIGKGMDEIKPDEPTFDF